MFTSISSPKDSLLGVILQGKIVVYLWNVILGWRYPILLMPNKNILIQVTIEHIDIPSLAVNNKVEPLEFLFTTIPLTPP
jgi:hypothetical protein